ncbi:hypothetical protein A3724_09845 [Alcanivorax sp. HI0033]|uniref:hypothetical protein n=1 Tax=unclassified Alcanivorax TaxID=2638842 RepID=UPI0007B9E5FF|nr:MULTISPECIES: hypothetical protein [unclassified Alcanivorax]KZX78463.1 hypothetical protein A3716_07985 [Alcanivorax sp. HI0011]KZX79562.1 hypothetical protein A3717_10045 [Alcanivorax sp. HI0013]KZY20965.1 hypothetical protein A3725_06860 [Alcanivorax sp. HI0035]KZX69570.1 hypothetical protein A3713_15605 [Alcanivorax sp. HI0003]KZX72459.1 hypothetical protein A3714_02925 [Alcanivorax sp. HI0007]
MSPSRIVCLLKASRRYPSQRRGLLERALRLCQQALAANARDRDALLWLGIIWWQLGATHRGRAILNIVRVDEGDVGGCWPEDLCWSGETGKAM